MSLYTPREERLNYLSHFVGLALAIIGSIFLIHAALTNRSSISVASVAIYCVGLIAVYATSSFYHYQRDLNLKSKLKTLDHMAIFLLIGGTYTPLVHRFLDTPYNYYFLIFIWILLIGGMIMKYFFTGRFRVISVFIYVFLGGLVIFIIDPILDNMPTKIFRFVLYGGLMYLFGVPFYMTKRFQYFHFIWHIFVIIASIFHFLAIYFSILAA